VPQPALEGGAAAAAATTVAPPAPVLRFAELDLAQIRGSGSDPQSANPTSTTDPAGNGGGVSTLVPSKAGSIPSGGGGGGRGSVNGKNEDAASQRSGDSDTSRGTSTTKLMSRLRRMLQDANPPLLHGLNLLLWAGMLVTALSLGLAATVIIVTRSSFISYSDNVDCEFRG